jgi:hypothetical protein
VREKGESVLRAAAATVSFGRRRQRAGLLCELADAERKLRRETERRPGEYSTTPLWGAAVAGDGPALGLLRAATGERE